MRSPVLILLGAPALAALNVRAPVWAPAASCRPAVRMAVATTSADLQTWLAKSAGVSPQFLDKVMATCEEEMIGSVDNLATLQRNGMLSAVFKPVIAASIETALGNGPEPAAPAAASSAPELPLADVKRQLMANQQDTWGTEVALRSRLAMFLAQENLKLGGSWDSISKQWAGSAFAPPTSASVAAPAAPVAAPAAPVPASSPPPAAAAPAAAPPPAAAAPAVEAPPAAAPPPASDKSTFTVTLKTPDGDLNFECPPEEYVLDWAEEQEIEGADDLPYACRAGSCSACAGKIVSGTMDTSGCSFLTAEQKAEGFVLTCTARPTSDVVIETHKEEDLF